MQHSPDIPFKFLLTQTCTNCQLAVTCGPVYVINDLSILCGRCRMTAKDHYRNYAYEALASVFLYTCRNWQNHCPAKLRWNDSLDHEPECNYTGCCTFCCHHPGAFCKGKRVPPDEEIKLTLVPENLLEHLECVLCRGYLNSSPIFIQSNGQNVCHRCIHANGSPPNCRRNHAYENFSQIFLFPCTYRIRGCRERFQFGRSIWRHEAKCEYGLTQIRESQSYQDRNFQDPVRSSLRPAKAQQRNSARQNQPLPPNSQTNDQQRAYVHQNDESVSDQARSSVKPKEKGIVKTHTGHIWATITPNKALFAPPDDEHSNANKQLLKSLARKQGRQIRRADEIGNEMGRRNSESESVSTNESYSMKTSGTSTPEPLDPRRPYIPPEDYPRHQSHDSRPNSRESGYQIGPLTPGRYPEDYRYNQRGLRPTEQPQNMPGHGQYPVLMPHQLSDGYDSVKRISKRESGQNNSNALLMNELKIRQDIIQRTNSIKGEREVRGPYKQYNNLGDIREVNRQYR